MALVTPTEVRNAARTYRTGILFQTDTDLTNLITLCQEDLERRTGQIFESDREVVDSELRHTGRTIQLSHSHLASIDELLIDESEYTLDSEEYDLTSGTIQLNTSLYGFPTSAEYNYQATYTTNTHPDENRAKDVLCRMVLDKVKNRESTVESDLKRLQKTIIGAI